LRADLARADARRRAREALRERLAHVEQIARAFAHMRDAIRTVVVPQVRALTRAFANLGRVVLVVEPEHRWYERGAPPCRCAQCRTVTR
jgi:hypothetical protein